jgi:hypothetical protein
MTEISQDFMNSLVFEMNEIIDAVDNTEPIKRPRGRPRTHDVKNVGSEYFREYYHLNKHHTYNCVCGAVVKRLNRATHEKTMKHKFNLYVQADEKKEENI